MAESRITTIANALCAAVNGAEEGTFSQSFEAVVRYRREKQTSHMATLDVGVYRYAETPTPSEDDTGLHGGDGRSDEIEYALDIAVRKSVKTDAETEDLICLCEEIRSFVSRLGLPTVAGDVIGAGATYDPIYDEEHLRGGVFFGLITAVFQAYG